MDTGEISACYQSFYLHIEKCSVSGASQALPQVGKFSILKREPRKVVFVNILIIQLLAHKMYTEMILVTKRQRRQETWMRNHHNKIQHKPTWQVDER